MRRISIIHFAALAALLNLSAVVLAKDPPASRDQLFEMDDEEEAPAKPAPAAAPQRAKPAVPGQQGLDAPHAKNPTTQGPASGAAKPSTVTKENSGKPAANAKTGEPVRPKAVRASGDAVAQDSGTPAEKQGGARRTPVRLSGFVQEEVARQYASPSHWTKVRTRAQVHAQGQAGTGIKWKLGARAQYDAVFDLTDHYPDTVRKDRRLELQLRENYADVSAGPLELRVGRQHIIWGEMVGLFFADVVSARDTREFVLTEFEFQRIPQWALRAEHFQGDWHTEVIWIPYVTVDEIGRHGDDFYPSLIAVPGLGLQVRDRVKPGRSLGDSNGGLRIGVLKDGWDVSAFHYSSIDTMPHFTRSIENLPGPTLVYTPRHARINQTGGTLAKDFGRFVLKSEAIYTRGRRFSVTDLNDADGVARQNVLDYVLGLEFGLREQEITFNAQAFQRVFLDYVSTLIPDRRETGVSFLVRGKFGTLTPQLLVLQSLNRDDRLLQASVDWNFARNTRARVGLDVLSGPAEGFFGQYASRDRAYIELKYSF